MVTPQTALTMNTKSNTSSNANTHPLKNKWNLWAHLPQDSDWSVKSYKLIYFKDNVGCY